VIVSEDRSIEVRSNFEADFYPSRESFCAVLTEDGPQRVEFARG
jgi:hypothetical protein